MGLHASEHVLNQTTSGLLVSEDRMADVISFEQARIASRYNCHIVARDDGQCSSSNMVKCEGHVSPED